jgi:hypothetical protein
MCMGEVCNLINRHNVTIHTGIVYARMPWVWFIITGSLCLAGSYWILSGQRAEPVEALVNWLTVNPAAPVFALHTATLGLPIAAQAAISFVASGLVGIAHGYLPQHRLMAAVLIFGLWGRILLWRVTEALIAPALPVATVLSLMMLVFECLAFVVFASWWFRHSRVKLPVPLPVLHKPGEQAVRVILWVDRQPIHLINQSLQSALGLQWSQCHVTVLDLGKRLDVAAICRKHQVDYWTTPEPQPLFVALIALLPVLVEPYALLLKAGDLLPPDALMAAMSYMQQETTTFVQMGHRQTHPDVLQRNLKLDPYTNTPATEQAWLGYVADAAAGLSPCLGTGTLFDKPALQQSLKSSWLATGLALQLGHKQKGCYAPHIRVLSHTPNSFGDWLAERMDNQRLRYQALALAVNPLAQGHKLRVVCQGLQALNPWLKWGFWLLPVLSLLTGAPIVPASLAEVAIYYVPFLLALHFGYPVLTRHLTQYLFADLYHAADCLLPAWPIPGDQLQRFRDISFLHWRWAKAPLFLAAITIISMFVGLARQWQGPDGALAVFIISLLWAGYNLVLLGGVSLIARERRETRLMPRLNTPLRGMLELPDKTLAIGQVVNLSESGLELQFDSPVPTVGAQTLTLLDWPNITQLVVEPVHSVIEGMGLHYVGFRILQRPDSQRQRLVQHLCRAIPPKVNPTGLGAMWGLLITLPFWLQGRPEIANRRKMPRFGMTLSAVLEHQQQYHVCFTQTISEQGVSVVIKGGHGIELGDTVQVRIQWADNQLSTLSATLLHRTPHLDNDLLSLKFTALTDEMAQTLIRQLYQPSSHLIRVSPALTRQLNLQLTLPDGHTVRGVTHTVCEKGIVAQFSTVEGLVESQALPVSIQWDDATAMSPYTMQIVAMNQPLKQLMLYFTDQTPEQVMAISQAMSPPASNSDTTPTFLK